MTVYSVICETNYLLKQQYFLIMIWCVCVHTQAFFFYLFAADERVSFLVTDVDSLFRADVPPLVMQDME